MHLSYLILKMPRMNEFELGRQIKQVAPVLLLQREEEE